MYGTIGFHACKLIKFVDVMVLCMESQTVPRGTVECVERRPQLVRTVA